MNVHIVDPSAFTPPYDHALSAALARAGAQVELITSPFGYGAVPAPDGYVRREFFYRHLPGRPGSTLRRAAKTAVHVPQMLAYRRAAAATDVVHFQWLDLQWLDRHLLPRRPVVLTAHDLLPREARPGQASAQRRLYDAVAAVIVHSQYGRSMLVDGLGVPAEKVAVVPHGAFAHVAAAPETAPLPPELSAVQGPVILFFGLLRPYKGLTTLLEAFRGLEPAQLWIVGRPRMPLEPLRGLAPDGVQFVPRFVSDAEAAACFRRADIVVLPYQRTERFDQSGVLASALAFGKPIVVSDVGGLGEVAAAGAARLVAPDDPDALHTALRELLGDPAARAALARAAHRAAADTYSWDVAAARTLEVYRRVVRGT